jgi:undecaprenyl diphosphate synthase
MTVQADVSDSAARSETLERVRQRELPQHVAVIMDGNGRWAADRGLPRWEGHRAGMNAVREVIQGAAEAGIPHLTLYAFSQENWQRPESEVSALMSLLEEYVEREKGELVDAGIRVSVFGDLDRLSPTALAAIADLEDATTGGGALFLHLAISYGSRSEIVGACRALARSCAEGSLTPDEITEDDIAGALLTREWPDPDLLIRTSGEWRISNFLLWQLAYAEIHVTPVLWPDFHREHLFEALIDYQGRQRRFGKVGA